MRKLDSSDLDFLRRDSGVGRFGEDMGEGATQRIAAARTLDLAAAAHRGILIGDGEKLEPDALRLQRAGHQLGGEAGNIGAAEQHGLDLGLMPTHHFEQKLEQEIGSFLGRGTADHGLGRARSPRLCGFSSSFMATQDTPDRFDRLLVDWARRGSARSSAL